MKKIYSFLKCSVALLLFMSFSATMAFGQQVVTATGDNTPQLIPAVGTSGPMTPVTVTIAGSTNPVSGGDLIGSDYKITSIDLELEHSWADDLDITLEVGGTTLELSTDNGGLTGLDAATNTLSFSDDAPTNVSSWTGGAPSIDGYQPEGGLLNDVFGGLSINDIFTLNITDDVGGDDGQLFQITINASAITCEVTCPEDIEVDNDPGECGAMVMIDAPVLSEGCVDTVLAGTCTEFLGEADLVFTGGSILDGLDASTVEITGVPAMIPSPATSVDVEICVSGDFGGSELELTEVLDENGTVIDTIGDELAGDCEDYCITTTLDAATYMAVAADGTISFSLAANPAVNPICASQTISATVCVPEIEVVMPLFTNDYNGTEDASDFYPVGETVVQFISQDAGGNESVCEFTVTVNDVEAPVFNCPSDVIVDLDAGECGAILNFDVSVTENCPSDEITFDIATNGGTPINCNTGNVSTGNQHWNPATAPLTGNVTSLSMPVSLGNAGSNYSANVYTIDGTFPGGTLTLVASGTVSSGGVGTDIIPMTATAPVEAGEDIVVEFVIPAGIILFPSYGAGNPDTYIQAPACGAITPTQASTLGVPPGMAWGIGITPTEVAGTLLTDLGSGDEFPIGVTTVTYEAIDGAGNVSTCEFNVTVNEFPEDLQSTTLSCNGQVNISNFDGCAVVLTPDMFLEGGPYGCYDTDYQINIYPFNNLDAPPLSDVAGDLLDFNGLLDAQHTYEIVDLDTGNKCWGNFIVEDKIAPTIACEDLVLGCDDPTEVGDVVPGGLSVYPGTPGDAINNTLPAVEIEIAAGGGAVTDLSLDIEITHTWIGDLTIELTSPEGTTVTVFDGLCANTDNLVATFEDGAPAFDCGNNAVGNTYSPAGSFADFNGENAAGTWVLFVVDGVGGDNGTLDSYSLNITDLGIVIGGAVADDNCSGTTLDYTEEIVDGDCTTEFAQQILRTWTATDGSGNVSESCTQTINITRETLATLELPLNYDGLPGNNDVIECDETVLNAAGELDPAVYGSPSGVGACGTIISYYTDVILPICDQTCDYSNSSYKVVRKWTILDWCTGEILEPTQILKVMDTTAPVLSNLPDITVSTDIWGCGATIDLPVAAATDNCTASGSISYAWSSTAGTQVGNTFVLSDPAKTMPGEPVVITVTASDCCGNSSTTDFEVTVQDLVPPVVVAETSRVVSLTTDGTAKIFAESFDDGSHDGCGPIGFFVKRMDDGSPCRPTPYPTNSSEDVDNKTFSDKVFFCCADETVMVQFRVCDDADMNGIVGSFGDNCNDAMVEVTVQDKLAPQIICPPNTTVSCVDVAGIDWNDADLLDGLFGAPSAAGTCNVDINPITPNVSDICPGEDVIIFRSFIAQNSAGSNQCTQQILITANATNSLTCNRISFDGLNNNIYNWCNVNDNTNDNDDDIPALTIDCDEAASFPEVLVDINGLCTEAGISVEADTFNFAGGACKKYLVHYEVIDQCIFDDNYVDPVTGEIDPYNSENGYFEFFLEIDAFDNVDPTPTCDDITVTATTCTGIDAPITVSAEDNCTAPEFLGFQWRLDVGADDSIDFPASGWYNTSEATANQVGLQEFPIGVHRFYWIIADGCGNNATCSQLVTIEPNDKEPTPYCYDGLSVAVMPSTGTVALWANDFDAGSFDNCDGDLLLTMVPESDVDGLSDEEAYDASFTGVQQPNGDWGWEFNCDYIENGVSAVIEVRIYVTDADGNYDYCTASLRIDDNFDACDDADGTLTYEVTGKLTTPEGDDVVNTDVTVDASFPEFPMTETVDGNYAFDLIENVTYFISPERNDDFLNGITTLDIVLIQKHILGVDLLDSPYQLIAADVDNNCQVSGSDLVQLRKLILGKYPNDVLPNNTSWRFIESDYVFTNPQSPCNFSEVAEILNLSADEIKDFYGQKVGDVNGSVQANATSVAETRTNDNVEFVVVDNKMSAGNTYNVEVLAKDFADVYGFQYTMDFNNVEFVNVEAGALNVTENNFGINRNGGLVVSYDAPNGVTLNNDVVLFTITVKANADVNVSESISMTSQSLAAEAYVGASLEIYGSDIVFRTNEGEVADAAFELYQNEPNPFNGATTIEFVLPTTSEATLSIYDVTGKVLYTKVDTYAGKTVSNVTINRNDLAATGVLYYKLESGDNVATMKMIVLD